MEIHPCHENSTYSTWLVWGLWPILNFCMVLYCLAAGDRGVCGVVRSACKVEIADFIKLKAI